MTKIEAAVTAAEQWAASPSAQNALLALESVPNLADVQNKDAAEADDCLPVAAAMVALAAANADFSNLTAVMAVEFAEKAAAGQCIQLADLVTSELL